MGTTGALRGAAERVRSASAEIGSHRAFRTTRHALNVIGAVRGTVATLAFVASIITGSLFVSRDAGSSPSAAPVPLTLASATGELIYQAALDAKGSDLTALAPATTPRPQILTAAGRITISAALSRGVTPIPFQRSVPARYVAQLDLAFDPDADAQLSWILSYSGDRYYELVVDGTNDLVLLRYVDKPQGSRLSLLPSPVAIKSLRASPTQIAVIVSPPRYLIFVNGALVGDVSDEHVISTDVTHIEMSTVLNRGALTLTGLRYYGLRSGSK